MPYRSRIYNCDLVGILFRLFSGLVQIPPDEFRLTVILMSSNGRQRAVEANHSLAILERG